MTYAGYQGSLDFWAEPTPPAISLAGEYQLSSPTPRSCLCGNTCHRERLPAGRYCKFASYPAPAPPVDGTSSPPVDEDGCTELERTLVGFLAEAYVDIDPRLGLGNSILTGYLRECLEWTVNYRQWRREAEPAGELAAPADLEAEYAEALAATPADALRRLRAAGVTERSLELVRPAHALLHLRQGGLFEFDPEGLPGFILPVRVERIASPESDDPPATIAAGCMVDMVVFTPAVNSRVALRYGVADWLGSCPADPEQPVRLYRTPLDWLRADCDGLVCLAQRPDEVYRFLTRFRAIDVEDDSEAHRLQRVLDRQARRPEILVAGRRRNG